MNARAAVRIAGLVGLFLAVAPVHVLTKRLFRRSRWPRRFLRGAAWIIGLRPRVSGPAVGRHSLIIANHTSWLDIVLLGGSLGCALVSKDELGHGFLHWLADQNATLYVKRSHVRGSRDQAVALAAALGGEKPVAVFPEGTTGPGTHLLPFRSTLLEAASFASSDVHIRPVAIDYGDAAREVAWFDESGKSNAIRLLGRKGTLPVTIAALPPLERSMGRKQLAALAHAAIADRLGFKSSSHSPIGEKR